MDKKTIYLLGIVLTIGIGMWLYHCLCCPAPNAIATPDTIATSETVTTPTTVATPDTTVATPQERLEVMKEAINADPLTLYFETGRNTPTLSPQERQKLSEIKLYLDSVPNAKIEVIGYADNVGSAEINSKISRQRADFVKSYFHDNGIPSDRIISLSKGSENPIASNETPEGRRKNRRVEIKIQ